MPLHQSFAHATNPLSAGISQAFPLTGQPLPRCRVSIPSNGGICHNKYKQDIQSHRPHGVPPPSIANARPANRSWAFSRTRHTSMPPCPTMLPSVLPLFFPCPSQSLRKMSRVYTFSFTSSRQISYRLAIIAFDRRLNSSKSFTTREPKKVVPSSKVGS